MIRHSRFLRLPKQLAVLSALPLLLCTHPAGAAVTPQFVHGNFAVPQTSQSVVTVPYTATQTAGNLNVVIVGWNDSSAHVTSLKDSKGNVYQLAVGPMVTGSITQAIYYAKNIAGAAASANAVTVSFSPAAAYPDVRILEYSGLDLSNPFEVAGGAIGNNAASSSGTVKTANATDLLIGANTVQTASTGAGSGFTKRLLTSPDGDLAEDAVVTAPGSYSASAPLSDSGGWVMQTVAFRAAGSASAPGSTPTPKPTPTPSATPKPTPTPKPSATPTPTATPKPTPTPTPTPKPSGSSVTLGWKADSATTNPASNPAGYRFHWGLASKNYSQSSTVGNTTSVTVSNLTSGTKYYCAVTAYNSAGLDSPPSTEVSFIAP